MIRTILVAIAFIVGSLAVAFLGCFTGVALAASQPTVTASATLAATEPAWTKNVPADKVIEWRRHIHQNPGLSFNEINTSNYVADTLETSGNIEVRRPTATSVIGLNEGALANGVKAEVKLIFDYLDQK